MKTTFRRLALAVALTALAFATVACGGSPSSPTSVVTPPPAGNTPPTPLVVYAGPPAGVSAQAWLVGFYSDMKLRRPDKGSTIHLDVSRIADTRFVAEMAALATSQMKGSQNWDLVQSAGDNTFTLMVMNDQIQCGAVLLKVGACTGPHVDSSGKVTGGEIQFTHPQILVQDRATILHEIFRTMGIVRCNPDNGIMACPAWADLKPSSEEIKVFLARYEHPPNAVYSPQ